MNSNDHESYSVERFSSAHALSQADFDRQMQKHMDHGQTGGALGVLMTTASKVVLIKRTGLHSGWAIPGGTIEEGEEAEDALRRELSEELGFSPTELTHAAIEEKIFRSPKGEELRFDLHVFVGRLDFDFEEMPAPEGEVDIECVRAFDYDMLPDEMILSDRKKLDLVRHVFKETPTHA